MFKDGRWITNLYSPPGSFPLKVLLLYTQWSIPLYFLFLNVGRPRSRQRSTFRPRRQPWPYRLCWRSDRTAHGLDTTDLVDPIGPRERGVPNTFTDLTRRRIVPPEFHELEDVYLPKEVSFTRFSVPSFNVFKNTELDSSGSYREDRIRKNGQFFPEFQSCLSSPPFIKDGESPSSSFLKHW